MPPPPLPPRPSLDQATLANHLDRIERVLAKGAEVLRHRRAALAPVLMAPQRFGPLALSWARKAEVLENRLSRCRTTLAYAKGQAPAQANQSLANLDLKPIMAMSAALDAEAEDLLARPQVVQALAGNLAKASGGTSRLTQPLAQGAPMTGKLMAAVQSWWKAAPLVQEARPAAGALPAKPGSAPLPEVARDPLEEAAAAIEGPFRAALHLVQVAVEKVAPRMEVVEVALLAAGRPGPPRPEADAVARAKEAAEGLSYEPAKARWLCLLCALLVRDEAAARAALIAQTQLERAQAALAEAQSLEAKLEGQGPANRRLILAGFQVGALKASAFPLGHLSLSFRGFSPLAELFPSPAGGNAQLGGGQGLGKA